MAILRGVRTAWLLLGITLALLLACELAAGWWLGQEEAADVDSARAAADTYAGADWAAPYFEEFARANRTAWHSYVYWRRQPFDGRFIHIDERGVRRTWRAPEAPADTRRVFLLGGSTMWGTGARDDGTIASYLARALAARGIGDVEVINFGEGGYVSMQEVVLLADQLRRGNTPTVAVFLDGVNDLFAALQAGVPGLPQNEARRVREFNIDVGGRIYREAASTLMQRSALFRLVQPAPAEAPPPPWDDATRRLADGALEVYLGGVEVARALARAHGFTALFYWQPIVHTKERLSPWERDAAAAPAVPAEFYRRSYERARPALAAAGVRDLSGVFGDDPQPVFIDFCHLGEKGNEVLAAAMVDDVAAALETRALALR